MPHNRVKGNTHCNANRLLMNCPNHIVSKTRKLDPQAYTKKVDTMLSTTVLVIFHLHTYWLRLYEQFRKASLTNLGSIWRENFGRLRTDISPRPVTVKTHALEWKVSSGSNCK